MGTDPSSLIDPEWPEEIQALRAALWSVVNWVYPLRLDPAAPGDDAEYLAHKAQLLPRVPVPGEWVEVVDHRAPVERVQWASDGRVIVRLRAGTVKPAFLEELERALADIPPP